MYLIINMGEFTLDNQILILNDEGERVDAEFQISQDETSDMVIGKIMDYPNINKIEICGFPSQTSQLKEELSNLLESCYAEKNIEIEVI